MPKNKFLQGVSFNWPAKILALVTAVVLFIIIQMVSVSERSFYIPLDVTLPDNYIVQNTVPGQVEITVRGPEDEIFRIIPEQISASLDFFNADAEGVHTRPVILDTENVIGVSNLVLFTSEPELVKLYFTAVSGGDS